LLIAHKLSHYFGSILHLTWLILWILTRWLLEREHFQPYQVHEIEMNWKLRFQWKKEEKKTQSLFLLLCHSRLCFLHGQFICLFPVPMLCLSNNNACVRDTPYHLVLLLTTTTLAALFIFRNVENFNQNACFFFFLNHFFSRKKIES
jgi:hypothetical protein